MLKLYGHEVSGNVYKVQLFLSLLGLEYEYVRINLVKGEQKSPEFLKLNPFGQVPVLIDGDQVDQDSQAILVYIARRYGGEKWLPNEADSLSRVMRWLSIAAGEISSGIAAARLFYLFNSSTINIEIAQQKAIFVLEQLEQHLSTREWLELGHPTIADLAVFPYIALAGDAKISLDGYQYVCAWLKRVKKLPGFVSMAGINQV